MDVDDREDRVLKLSRSNDTISIASADDSYSRVHRISDPSSNIQHPPTHAWEAPPSRERCPDSGQSGRMLLRNQKSLPSRKSDSGLDISPPMLRSVASGDEFDCICFTAYL